jgi:hypothetical protein
LEEAEAKETALYGFIYLKIKDRPNYKWFVLVKVKKETVDCNGVAILF